MKTNKYKKTIKQKGFTLIEILVVIGIIGILATVVLVAVNPSRQFKQARDSQRVANVNTILNALGQNIADHQGNLFCDGSVKLLDADISHVMDSSTPNGFDIASCVVPDYMPKLPYDPKNENAFYSDEDNYNTGYYLTQDGLGRLTVLAQGEIQSNISVTR